MDVDFVCVCVCMYIYIYMVLPPHVPTPLCLNLSLREAWVRGIPLSPSLSPKSQVQDGVGVWDWGECLQIVTLFFHVWRVPSRIIRIISESF